MLTAPLLERSTRHQLQWLPVGSSSRDQTLCRTPLPSAGVWRPAPPEDSNPPPCQRPPPVAPTLLPVPAQSQVEGSPGPGG